MWNVSIYQYYLPAATVAVAVDHWCEHFAGMGPAVHSLPPLKSMLMIEDSTMYRREEIMHNLTVCERKRKMEHLWMIM